MRQLLTRLFQRRGATGSAAVAETPQGGEPLVLTREWIDRRRRSAATYAGISDAAVESARNIAPSVARDVIAAAERVLRHEFDLLGSGPFVPADPDRPARDGYQPIDWFLDPVRQLRFDAKVPHRQWRVDLRPGNADIKYPWELARCQHWVTLAQAFRLTGDPRFAREIARELDDFVESNPPGIGVNWTCTMDVGLRVVSWVVALDIVRECGALDDAFWLRAYTALHDHGTFIRGNLEDKYEVTSNHFLSNIVGLWYLAAAFDGQDSGRAWSSFARGMLEREIDVQVLPDGADFESAVPYHRLVAELFLGSARLGDVTGAPLSAHLRGRVRDMVQYLAGVMRPDTLMPQSGDADDGRLHVMTGVGLTSPQDPRHLLGPAAILFDHHEWLGAGGEHAAWEAAWWGLAVPQTAPAPLPGIVHLFPDAGHAVAREHGNYLLVTNSIVGTRGFGNHKHNDQLSFEYHVAGVPIVVDPGSYVYTSDPDARNLFRGTAYHNTLQLDDLEQNRMNREWLFRLFETAHAKHISFGERDGIVEYVGQHSGYSTPEAPIVHERRFRFDLKSGVLRITDTVTGATTHQLKWHFHFAPGVTPKLDGTQVCVLQSSSITVRLTWTQPAAAAIGDVWYSPSYGARVPCKALDLSMASGTAAHYDFSFEPQTRP